MLIEHMKFLQNISFEISIKDIISPSMFNKRNSPMLIGYNKFAQFLNGKTYQKPITYYVHDKTGKIKSKVLPGDER